MTYVRVWLVILFTAVVPTSAQEPQLPTTIPGTTAGSDAERRPADTAPPDRYTQLEQLRHAIERIDTGSYGRCTRCGSDIGAARLEALPAAALCLACADVRSTALG